MKFYVLLSGRNEEGSEFWFEPDKRTKVGNAPKCPSCCRYIGFVPLIPPISGTLHCESGLVDLAGNIGVDVIISEQCLRIFEANLIRGINRCHRVEVTSIDGPAIIGNSPQMFLGEIGRWSAEIDRAASVLRTSESVSCRDCGYAGLVEGWNGICIREESWNGDDLFIPKGVPGTIVVSARVRELCIEQGLAVSGLLPAETFSVQF